MKIYDFDEKFYEYMMTWMAIHPGLKEDEIEERYNEIMRQWLSAPAKWLNGEKPGEYFDRYSEPKDLIKLLKMYDEKQISIPEPLYSRIAFIGAPCVDELIKIVKNADASDELRGTAIALLDDIDDPKAYPLYADLMANSNGAEDELANHAADCLEGCMDTEVLADLLARYDSATSDGQMLIIGVCAQCPGMEGVYEKLEQKLMTEPENRQFIAALIGSFGDQRGIEACKKLLNSEDIGYVEYLELCNAIEALGGDVERTRTFYGDPDFEALRHID